MNDLEHMYSRLEALAKGKEKSRVKVAQQWNMASIELLEKVLARGIAHKDFKIRRTTMAIIGELNQPDVDHIIKQGLLDNNKDVIQMSVWAIGKLKAKRFLPELIKIFKHESGFKIRKTIIWTFGELRDKSVLPILENVVKEGSTRLIKGILVCALKLGQKSFLQLILQLNMENKSTQKSLEEVSKESNQVRKAILQAINNQKNKEAWNKIISILPYISLEEGELKKCLQDERELIRIAACQAIIHALISTEVRREILLTLLQDSSNKVVKEAINQLKPYVGLANVQHQLQTLQESHPSPQIQKSTQSLLDKHHLIEELKNITPKWGRFLLETLPGLEEFVADESQYYKIPMQIICSANGWLEIKIEDVEELHKLRRLHTVSKICSILMIEREEMLEKQKEVNPYVGEKERLLTLEIQHQEKGLEIEKIKLNQTYYQIIPLYTERNMYRPKRILTPVSLDWRVARAINICSTTQPTGNEIVVDITCGSGTILLDRASLGPYQKLLGGDLSRDSLHLAKRNLNGLQNIELMEWDAANLPLPDKEIDIVVANLPFGRRVGHHELNVDLYPKLTKEICRILKVEGKAILLTQEVKLLEDAFRPYKNKMKLVGDVEVQMGGLTPHILIWQKNFK